MRDLRHSRLSRYQTEQVHLPHRRRESRHIPRCNILRVQTPSPRAHGSRNRTPTEPGGEGIAMSLATMEEAHKVIQSIRFTLLSPTELRKISAVEVQAADTYDEDGVPIVSGLMDGRLGTVEPRQKCKTCGNTASGGPGHARHIELSEDVSHVRFVKQSDRIRT